MRAFDCDADHVYAVTLSAELSGSYNSAVLGKSLLQEENPGKQIYVFNSKSASVGQSLIAMKIQECEEAGYHGIVGRRASGQYGSHSFHGCRNPPGFPDSVLSGHHHGSCLHSHGFSRQPVGKESLKGTGTEKENYKNGYINPNQSNHIIKIYNSDDELMFRCLQVDFKKICNSVICFVLYGAFAILTSSLQFGNRFHFITLFLYVNEI